ncbi:hypothetical protein AMS68_002072 [Peltaster fructicola]|uniref:Long-chain-alcohol oxidase n=1 Tax=Peltaster fructicola TaxID=286661 RepID=A0A6H0XPJ5_9PEZI|nr:hypothetical protein AMS68_002072 [Peltaster fructicola]
MTTSIVAQGAGIPLPPLPKELPLDDSQWAVLGAILDTVIPSFVPGKGNYLIQHPVTEQKYEEVRQQIARRCDLDAKSDLLTRYLTESATSQPEFKDAVLRLIGEQLDSASTAQLAFVLRALTTRVGALALTGYATPIPSLPVADREKILQTWSNSRLPTFRKLARSLTTLGKLYWVRTSPTLGHVLGYPRVPGHGAPAQSGFPFEFIQIPPGSASNPEVLETDVVIVGSGCGGAVAAHTLAQAGLKVMVVDKSYYFDPQQLPLSELEASLHMFENGGVYQSDDASIAVVAGSAWGGGGTINWSAALQTLGPVRKEWSEKFGLKHFTSAQWQKDLDYVCDRMGVGKSDIPHNQTNRVLLEGGRKLGWAVKVAPQNTGGEAHNCGYCTLGCGSCGKKGPTESWLPDAAKAGATFLEGFNCEKIVFDKNKNATGVQGHWTSRSTDGTVHGPGRRGRPVIIKAKRVISSASSVGTPPLLLRSGVTNQHVGRHLHLHPVSMVAGVWDEDVRPWEGPILTTVVSEFDNMDGEGYGPKLEGTCMLPGFFLPFFPWTGGLQFKEHAAKMKKMTGYIALTRDRYGGRVYVDKDNKTRIAYTPSAYDQKHILEGVVRLAQINYVQGCREVHVAIPGIEPFVRPQSVNTADSSIDDPLFAAWIDKLRAHGFPAPDSSFASAHQMGSSRMGTAPSNSVVDPSGQVWGHKGLYICDTSVFPSASGVNPMITCMAICRGISQGIANDLMPGSYATISRSKL